MRHVLLSLVLSALLSLVSGAGADPSGAFVRVSLRDARYLELSDGRPYIPVGLNLIAPNTREEEGLQRMGEWMQKLSENGGNYIRVWLSSPFWDVEHQRSGQYDEAKGRRVDQMLALAGRHGLRVKMTIEHFRSIEGPGRQKWAHKPLHLVEQGGTATNMADFFAGQASRDRFKQKLAWYASRYNGQPSIYGWELWNEINAVSAGGDYMAWTEVMLKELDRIFPRNLAMQSLGSYDSARVRELYCRHSKLPGNDLAQVHRYLDLGASLEVCHGPVDVLAADAVREILACQPARPVILAESGAVEPRHTGPFKLYAKDRDGILLHDVLFAPFFAGAAGAGQIWHWDAYVDRNNLWWQFSRFAAVVKDIDPAAEHFEPSMIPHERLRVYILRGRNSVLAWCRDAQNTWQTELEQGRPPDHLNGIKLEGVAPGASAVKWRGQAYDPWNNRWHDIDVSGPSVVLPTFSRSIVVRLAR